MKQFLTGPNNTHLCSLDLIFCSLFYLLSKTSLFAVPSKPKTSKTKRKKKPRGGSLHLCTSFSDDQDEVERSPSDSVRSRPCTVRSLWRTISMTEFCCGISESTFSVSSWKNMKKWVKESTVTFSFLGFLIFFYWEKRHTCFFEKLRWLIKNDKIIHSHLHPLLSVRDRARRSNILLTATASRTLTSLVAIHLAPPPRS